MRKILIACGLALVVIGGVLWWRASHPPLTDAQQIEADLSDLTAAIEGGQARRLVEHLSPDFQWRDFTRDFISKNFGGFSMQWRDVDLRLAGVKVEVQGESATSEGRFTLRYRSRGTAYIETRVGRFKLFWQKRDGEWLVVKAEGGENIEP